MYLIIGLGNPESDYSNTRHNMGFCAINLLANKYNIDVTTKKFKSLVGKGNIEGEKVILLKPQTFMNLSGEALKECIDFYKIKLDKIIVIYDDMDIEPAKIKIRKKGSAGSHNGMKSITQNINSQEFARIRIGIGKPENKQDMINYVIGYVPKTQLDILQKGIELAAEAVPEIIKNGIDIAMNTYN